MQRAQRPRDVSRRPRDGPAYFDAEIRPRLGAAPGTSATSTSATCAGSSARQRSRWSPRRGRSRSAWWPPRPWLCGTPVAGYRRGGLREVVTPETGRLATATIPRPWRRRSPPRYCSTVRRCGSTRSHARCGRMVDEYEALFDTTALGASRMIGYYVHHVGAGHLHRARAVAERTLGHGHRTLLAAPTRGWPGPWVRLARDDRRRLPSTRQPADGFTGSRGRRWSAAADGGHVGVDRHRQPDVVVSDVSVEVTLLARLHGSRWSPSCSPGT